LSPSQIRQTNFLSIVGGIGLAVVWCAFFRADIRLAPFWSAEGRGAPHLAYALLYTTFWLLVVQSRKAFAIAGSFKGDLAVRSIMLATMFLAAVTPILDW
jgi:hypothetical protein